MAGGFASQADGTTPVTPGGGFASQVVTPDAAPIAPQPTGKTVNVVSPDGKVYGLDAAYLPDAAKQGYQIESAEQAGIRRYLEENKGLGGAAKVALRGMLDEATFGAGDVLVDSTQDPYELAKFRALRDASPVANYGGRAAGFALSMLYGGEFFQGANAAGKAARAGVLAERALAKGIAAEAAYRIGAEGAEQVAKHAPGIARQALAAAADYGAQGMVFAAPKAAAQLLTGDPDKAAETWIWGAAGGAALGGVVGAAGGLLGRMGGGAAVKALPEVAAMVEQPAAQSVVKSTAGKLAEEQAFKSLASNHASLKKAAREALTIEGGQRGIGRTLLDEGLVRRVGEDVEDYAVRLAEAKANAGEAVGAMYKRLDELGVDTGLSVKSLAKKMRDDVLNPLKAKPGFESVADKVEAYVNSFEEKAAGKTAGSAAAQTAASGERMTWTEFMKGKMGPYMKSEGSHQGAIDRLAKEWAEYKAGGAGVGHAGHAATEASEASVSFERLHDVRASLDDLVYRNAGATPAEHIKELREIRRMIQRDLVEKGEQQAQKFGEEFAAPLKQANLKYSRLSAAEKAAADFAEVRKLTNRSLSPTDYGVGGIGALGGMMANPLGALAGVGTAIAHKFVREEGNAIAARGLEAVANGRGLAELESAFARHDQLLSRVPAVLDHMAGRKSPARETLGVNVLSRFLGMEDHTKLDKPNDVMAFADRMAALASNPDDMEARSKAAIAPLSADAPEVAMAVAAKLPQVAQYLASQAPQSPYSVPVPFTPAPTWKPTDAQVKDYRTKVAVALDPYKALDALADGTLTKAHVDALQAVAPKLYQEMLKRINDYGSSGKAPSLPYAQRLKLSMMTGAPLDRSLAQLSNLQGIYQTKDASKVDGGGRPLGKSNPALQTTDIARLSG